MSENGFYLLPTNKLYKKEDTRQLKNDPAGYVGSFDRNLEDIVDNFVGSDFYSRITADLNIPREDVQKYILATSDFAKSIQTGINHYVTRDRINDASFRQKLDPISKNILRRQNPLELVFEDISTFDAENPTVGSLLRELDLKKKQSDSDFIKSLPSQPEKEFEIKKRLDRLRQGGKNFSGKNNNSAGNNNNNNNNNFDGGNNNLFGPGGEPPSLTSTEDFLDGGPRPPPPPPPPPSISGNLFNSTNAAAVPPPTDDFNVLINRAPTSIWSKGIGNDLFSSQAAMASPREEKKKTKTQHDVDDFLYEMPDQKMPDLEIGDGLLNSLGTTAQNLFDTDAPPSKKEEEDEILKDFMEEYDIENIKNTMDETAQVPESIYFFMVETVSSLLTL